MPRAAWLQAEECYIAALAINPRHYNAHFGLGVLKDKQHKFEESEVYLQKAVSINPHKCVSFTLLLPSAGGAVLHGAYTLAPLALNHLRVCACVRVCVRLCVHSVPVLHCSPVPRCFLAKVVAAKGHHQQAFEHVEKVTAAFVYWCTELDQE